MTAEIAVLNKFGVALASDSAITVEHYHDGEIKTKVYNTANKLFSLSKHEPVGIMFYNTVTLGGVPWETIIKCYRRKLGKKKFSTIKEYGQDFFDWLNSAPSIFTQENIADIIANNFYREMGALRSRCKNKAVFNSRLDKRIADLERAKYIDGFDDAFGKAALEKYDEELNNAIKYMIKKSSYVVGLKKKIVRLCELLLTKRRVMRGYAGIVIAGFGSEESLPRLEEFYVDIIVDKKVRFWRRKRYAIDNSNTSEVVPLADSEAIQTLIEGISPTFRSELVSGVFNLIKSLPEAILAPISELTEAQKAKYANDAKVAIPKIYDRFADSMVKFRNETYTYPIKQSISSLPISELGNVAEAFLGASQVLKKVNPDLETVGGPVDIAVISKGDGFVWIKRKHYFDETINPSFKLKYLES